MKNDLLESKHLLEAKISLQRKIIFSKEDEYITVNREAQRLNNVLVTLNQELWKDELALASVNEQLNPIEEEEAPTLALQKKNPLWKSFGFVLAFLLLTSTLFAQAFVSGEAGNRMGINAGAIVHNVEFKGGALMPYTRSTVTSNITYAEAGYKIGNNFNITPLVGIAHYHNTIKGFQEINKTALSTSLEFGRDFETAASHFGNYYLFITQAHSFFAGAGFKFYIK